MVSWNNKLALQRQCGLPENKSSFNRYRNKIDWAKGIGFNY